MSASQAPTTFAIYGDSTADDYAVEWAGLFWEAWRVAFPAYTVQYRLWSHAQQGWGVQGLKQTGTAGLAKFVAGTTSTRAFSTSTSTSLSLTGDMSIRIKLNRANWLTDAASIPFSKWGTIGQQSWRVIFNIGGTLTFEHTSDGTTIKSSTTTIVLPFSNSQIGYVKIELDVDNGSNGHTVIVTTSTNGASYTALETLTSSGVTSVFASTAALQICNTGSNNGPGDYYGAELYSGIGSVNQMVAAWGAGDMITEKATIQGLDVCGNLWVGNVAAITQGITGAPALTLLNGSTSGQAIAYFNNIARFNLMAQGELGMVMISLGHNESTTLNGAAYSPTYLAYLNQLLSAHPNAALVVVTQNAKEFPESTNEIANHADRQRMLALLAKSRGFGLVDTFSKVDWDGLTIDGIHPNSTGHQLWADVALAALS